METSTKIKTLKETLKGNKSPYEQSQLCFNAYRELEGSDKEKAFEMYEYYSRLHEELRPIEDEEVIIVDDEEQEIDDNLIIE